MLLLVIKHKGSEVELQTTFSFNSWIDVKQTVSELVSQTISKINEDE